jgi:multiple sugar transport system ATP-binding protein
MNLIEGHIRNGTFEAKNTIVAGTGLPDGPVTLGFRAEDASLAKGKGQISAPIYSIELLGDATMITVRISGALVSVKTDKAYRAQIGDAAEFSVPVSICHFFDAKTGVRIDR